MIDIAKYNRNIPSTWCPGCGNFGIHMAIKKALSESDISPTSTFISFDIGCNGNGADKINVNAYKGLHGRSIPLAAGVKLANRGLTVIADIGDGGVLHEGIDHLIHAIRSNYDITILIHNNQNFALTTGQATATTQEDKGMYGLPDGRPEGSIDITNFAIKNGASFVARGYSGDINQLSKILKESFNHKGCSVIEVLQYCPTYNKETSPAWFNENLQQNDKVLDSEREILDKLSQSEKVLTGILLKKESSKTFYENLANREGIDTDIVDEVKGFNIEGLLEKFK